MLLTSSADQLCASDEAPGRLAPDQLAAGHRCQVACPSQPAAGLPAARAHPWQPAENGEVVVVVVNQHAAGCGQCGVHAVAADVKQDLQGSSAHAGW
jgi:hypothetical protein